MDGEELGTIKTSNKPPLNTTKRSKAIPIVAPIDGKTRGTNSVESDADDVRKKHVVQSDLSSSTPASTTGVSSPQAIFQALSTPSNFDVYAIPFVSDTLRAVNTYPTQQIFTTPLQRINCRDYVSSFAGSSFLSSSPTSNSLFDRQDARKLSSTIAEHERFPDRLTPEIYRSYWKFALSEEFRASTREYGGLALWDVPLHSTSSDRGVGFLLAVPGLAEENLHFEVGDQVFLRQLQFFDKGNLFRQAHAVGTHLEPYQSFHHQYPYSAPPSQQPQQPPQANASNLNPALIGFNGVENIAIVNGIDRRQEVLNLRVEGLLPESMRFNVRFQSSQRRKRALEDAMRSFFSLLADHATPDFSWPRCMLFPEPEDGVLHHQSHQTQPVTFKPFDNSLNQEQLLAVQSIALADYGTLPFLLDGPPGTGKTKTLIEAILQLLQSDDNYLLVCAASDQAADVIALRLVPHLKPNQLLRLNDPFRTFAEVTEKLLMYCCIDQDRFSLPFFADFMRCRVIVTSCRDATMLVEARLTNTDLATLEHSMAMALHPELEPNPTRLHFTALIIDEAAQATEPEALIPLSVVVPPSSINYERDPQLILAGDPKQLNPRTASKEISIETSLLARLLDRPAYRAHPFARSQRRHGTRATLAPTGLPLYRRPFATLIRNYRSHAAILAVPSALFYNDTLIPVATDTNDLVGHPIWQGRGWPILFHQHAGPDELEREGGGWYNVQEAHQALRYAQSFLQHHNPPNAHSNLLPQEIAIITPFTSQVRLLRTLARSPAYSLWNLNIGPLAAFQGLESRVVILCTTRSRSRFLEQDIKQGLGVIHEAKRFNVAVTRARQGLVVLGDPWALEADGNWRVWLGFAWRNGCWRVGGGDERVWKPREEVGVPSHVSVLEAALLSAGSEGAKEKEVGVGSLTERVRGLRFGAFEDEDAMYASALAAEAALRDD